MNGMLLKRWWKTAPRDHAAGRLFHVGNHVVSMRPGLVEFISKISQRFDLGLWTSMTEKNMLPLLSLIKRELSLHGCTVEFKFAFHQSQCRTSPEFPHPSRAREVALCKPFDALLSEGIEFDPLYTCLIDDAPVKGAMNPEGTCISPCTYQGSLEDTELLCHLLPYLKQLADYSGSVPEFTHAHPYELQLFETAAQGAGKSQMQLFREVVYNHQEYDGLREILDKVFSTPGASTWLEFVERVRCLQPQEQKLLYEANPLRKEFPPLDFT